MLELDKEASQTRDHGVAKSTTLRATINCTTIKILIGFRVA